MQMNLKKMKAAYAAQTKDYSAFHFGLNKDVYEKGESIGVSRRNILVALVLLSVAQVIECEQIKAEIEVGLKQKDLKHWLIYDVIVEADNTLFNNDELVQTIAAYKKATEEELEQLFEMILRDLKY